MQISRRGRGLAARRWTMWERQVLADQETKDSNPPDVKSCGGCSGGRNSQPPKRVCWRDPQDPRTHTNPPTQESALTGHICHGGSDGKWGQSRVNERRCSLFGHSPRDNTTTQQRRLTHPGKYLRPTYNIIGAPRQRNRAQMKEQIKTPEK